jgi:pSer/pThr/pTyr-binding forkhead associated (FHA) protein
MILSGESLIVGRSPRHTGLLLDDLRVSRLHLRIQRDPDTGVTVTDMFSANGSTLDGRPLPPGIPFHWLIDQNVMVGGTRLILKYGETEGL